MTSELRGPGVKLRRGLLAASIAIALTSPGCSEKIPDPVVIISRKPIKVDAIPEPILKAAKQNLTGVKFDQAWSNQDKDGSIISYELRGTTRQGKIRDLRLSVTGTIMETD